MRRRALLAGLVGVTAGCIGGSPGDEASTTDRRTATPPSGSPSATNPPAGSTTAAPSDTSAATPNGDAAGYRIENLAVSGATDGPDHRYVLAVRSSYSKAAVEREEERTGRTMIVRSIEEIEPEPVREAIETAIQAGEWRADTLPDGLRETIETVISLPTSRRTTLRHTADSGSTNGIPTHRRPSSSGRECSMPR